MKFYVTERLGPKRSLTPEGFLLCQDVPVARVGFQDYLDSELPTLEADRGIIRVQRLEDEVFKPEALASIAGKSVVIDHPDDDVTPANWREFEVGVALEPRRGQGIASDVALADLLVKDPSGIKAILDGTYVEISLGYDAEYEMVRPGLYTQHSIIVNHVALVKQGRCGPTCSIGDHSMPVVINKKTSWKDRLLAAVKSKDEAAIEKVAGEVTEDADEPIAETDLKSGSGITINVHGTGATAPGAAEAKTGDEDGDKDDPFKKVTDALEGITKSLTDLSSRMDAYDKASTADTDGDDDDEKDGKGKTRDAAGLAPLFQDVVARAEILVPGIKVPTFDAKAERKKTRDALCAFRRKVLDKAYATDEGKAAIEPLLAGAKTLDTKSLTCDAAAILFTAASESVKALNRAATTGAGKIRANDTGAVKVPSIADINKLNEAAWKPKI